MARKPAAKQSVIDPPIEPVALSPEANEVGKLYVAITAALDTAKAGGLPQGFIVAVLHALALKETQRLLGQ
ncbi:hypothetical protein [Pseudomonas bohemica]|uniref:hypothetical protein n=1 Tax=Pseudomonas bohemica TaxID=2044872 RepID=UPI000DA5FC8E|nr:hypothetical protein [Pseudomonas bohemica]